MSSRSHRAAAAHAPWSDVDGVDRRSGVEEIQRARMLAALVEVAGERGAGGVTVARVVTCSGVSRRTFYELFEDRDACFLAAFDLAVGRAAQRVLPAFEAAGAWRERMRAGLAAMLEFLEDEPGMGRLLLVDALGAGAAALARRTSVVEHLIDAVDEGRREARASARPTRLTAEGVVGAVLAVLHARLANGGAPAMAALLGPLLGIVVLPYQGQAAAARELARPAPARRRAIRSGGNPLHGLDMRLTYRTVRVLLTIADGPGASNREVADAAGVADQGQISKLLARLEHLGLIENSGAGPSRGERNAWRLTPKGREIEHTIRQQTAPVDA
jgi:AcrR family transcriptional regulator/DNA-binding MarR family transcriptional regulator